MTDFPEVQEYGPGVDRETPAGFFWFKLPDIPALSTMFTGGSDARALVCARCGALVAVADMHTRWHEGGA